MERGLLWLPLLGLFIWLSWAGWNEYRKLEAYKEWATAFERAKYDIYAVLGQGGDRLIWGAPTRSGPQQLQEISLNEVATVSQFNPDSPPPENTTLPRGCNTGLQLTLTTGDQKWIPFTDAELALAWQNRLQTLLESLQSTPHS